MTWATINIVTGLLVSIIVAYKLGALGHKFNLFERVGMSMIGAGCLLRVGPILTHATGGQSPFDDWSVTVLHTGLLVYFVGRMVRHAWANREQKRHAAAHLQARGKM